MTMYSAIKNTVILSAMIVAMGGVLKTTAADTEANKALERRVFEEIWNQGALDVADEIFAPNAVLHGLTAADLTGPAAFKHVVATYRAAFPDIHWSIDDQTAEGDMVATRLTGTATHQGELMGIPATGLPVTVTAVLMVRVADGKIQESWNQWDQLGLMLQLGVAAPPRPGPQFYLWDAPSDITGDAGDPVTNKLLVLRVKSQFWNGKDIAGLDETHHANALGHDVSFPAQPGYDSYRQGCLAYQMAFPDLHHTTDAILAEGDKVVVRWTGTGTHQGELIGIPASGKPVKFTGITIYRIADGKIAESWWAYDAFGLVQQITSPPEWTPEGTWIVTSPSPMGPLTMVHVMYPLDSSGARYGGVLWQVNPNPTFFGTFPSLTGGSQFWATESRRIAPNAYETGMIVYSTQPAEGLLDQVASVGILNATWTITGAETNEGAAMLSSYLAGQDANGDGLPDEGQAPVACTPFSFTSKRVRILPACVPARTPAPAAP
jgi:steroid delta-isomerase-like uncharacterized protein